MNDGTQAEIPTEGNLTIYRPHQCSYSYLWIGFHYFWGSINFVNKWVLKKCREYISDKHFDVIHVHDLRLVKVGVLLAKQFNMKVIADLHENYPAAIKSYVMDNSIKSIIRRYSVDRYSRWVAYEKQILQKSRSAAAINDDYIKILQSTYRLKFVDAVARYGTLAAGLRYMHDTYGITVRADVLRRMRAIIPAFNAEIEDALAMYQGSLQMAMHQRAVEGIEKIIRDRDGNEIARERVYSDSLLAKMVDTHTPEYKEAKQKETNKGNTINVQIIKDFNNYKSTRDN